MNSYIVDASIAVEYLLRTQLGLTVAETLDSAALAAPELLDAEVLSVLRRAVLQGRLDEPRAQMVVNDLARWPVDRISHRVLAQLAWQHRRNVSAYDAFYVAAARACRRPPVDCGRATGQGVGLECGRSAHSSRVTGPPASHPQTLQAPLRHLKPNISESIIFWDNFRT